MRLNAVNRTETAVFCGDCAVNAEAPRKGFAELFLIARPAIQLTESAVLHGVISGYFPVRLAEVRP